ncbi:Methylosome subunit pICln [Pseudolycoriella hygida]|uniref:Methylosome subunit pICln n=1 Tax=Pseudolycoriella hygida TaxID=35572 RepID=A0A9Q0MUA9_9DIPT|nr:Methylosome subunit pICln [Pseudolycoriella hygida]
MMDPVKCVYFLLDYDLLRPGVLDRYSSKDSDVDEGNYEEDDEANRPSIVEICLIPSDTEEVDKIFHAIFQCQIWNPDSTYTLSEEEEFMEASDESGEELDAEEMENLNIDDE